MYKHIVTNLSACIAKPMQLLLQDQTLTSSAETLCQALLQLWGLHEGSPNPFVHGQLGGFGSASLINVLASGKFVGIPRK